MKNKSNDKLINDIISLQNKNDYHIIKSIIYEVGIQPNILMNFFCDDIISCEIMDGLQGHTN